MRTFTTVASFIAIASCGTESSDDTKERVATESEALQCGDYVCSRSSDPTDSCSPWGTWPHNTVYYVWGAGADQTSIRQAMNDWQALTSNLITFKEVGAGDNPTAIETIGGAICDDAGKCLGEGVPYNWCVNSPNHACTGGMSSNNMYHELGHVLGLEHEFARYDRTHYWWAYDDPKAPGLCSITRCATPSAQNSVDFGPFDYRSTMEYYPTDPDYVRFDGTPIVPGATCGNIGPDQAPVCSNPQYCFVSSCTSCRVVQPQGLPTPNDVSAVIELYDTAAGGLHKFKRTVTEDIGAGVRVPFNYALSSSATIPSTSSPALETWGGDSRGIYIRGSDDAIWKKYWDTSSSTWSGWSSLGRPAGSAALSDPAVVSWGSGRSDVVVRQGTSIYIMSTPTWMSWQSLGSPPPGAASAPAIASWGTNHLDVFVRAADNGVYHKWCGANCSGNSGTWSDWSRLGTGTFLGKPAVTTRPNQIDVYGHGMDHNIWVALFNGAWGSWQQTVTNLPLRWDPSCPDCSSPAATSLSDGSGAVFVRGANDGLFALWFASDHSWRGYTKMGGVLTSSPATISKWFDSTAIVATMAEESDAGKLNYGVWLKGTPP